MRSLSVLAVLVFCAFAQVCVAADGGARVIDLPETIKAIYEIVIDLLDKRQKAADQWEYRMKLEDIRIKLANLAADESLIADQIRLGVKQARIARSDNITVDALNKRLDKTLASFEELSKVLNSFRAMPAVDEKVIGGLRCFSQDSLLRGFASCSGAPLFQAGRIDSENKKALQFADAIQKESQFLYSLAQKLGAAIKTIDNAQR
jgi:hypothetical protein